MKSNIAKRLSMWAVAVAGILLIPFLSKAPWTASDFVFAAAGLFGFATLYELVTRNMNNRTHRIAVGIAIVLAILMVIAWAATGPD